MAVMTRYEARRAIIQEWKALPQAARTTNGQAAAFAMSVRNKYLFRAQGGNRYQVIKGWLLAWLADHPPPRTELKMPRPRFPERPAPSDF